MIPAHQMVMRVADKLTLPPVYEKVRALMQMQETNIDQYVDVVATDPALAERITNFANSQFLGYRRRARTLKQAMSLIGAIQVHDILLGCLAMRAFDAIPATILDLTEYWQGNVFCGIAARSLSRHAMLPARDRMFTLGLLHDIGHIAMYTTLPAKMQEAIANANDRHQALHLLEKDLIGFHYGEAGKEMATYWKLPEIYCDVIEWHMEPTLASSNRIEKAIVCLARHLLLDQPQVGINQKILPSCPGWQILQTPIDKLTYLREESLAQVPDVMSCLAPDLAINSALTINSH